TPHRGRYVPTTTRQGSPCSLTAAGDRQKTPLGRDLPVRWGGSLRLVECTHLRGGSMKRLVRPALPCVRSAGSFAPSRNLATLAACAVLVAAAVSVRGAVAQQSGSEDSAGAKAAAVQGQRVFTAGHSFHVFMPKTLAEVAASAGIEDHRQLGVQSIGG